VRREQDVVHAAQRTFSGQRLHFKNIQRRASQPAGLKRAHQRGLLHDRPAGGVDKHRAGLAPSKALLIHQVEGRRSERTVQADEVRPLQQLAQRHGFHAVFQQKVRRDFHDVIAKQFHPKSAGAPQHRFAHIAHANYAQGFLTEGVTGNFLPFPGFHRAVHRAKAARECKHISKHTFRDRDGKGVGCVAHAHPKFSRGLLVDRIDAGAPLGDYLQTRLAGLDDAARVAVVTADGAVKPPGISQQLFFRKTFVHLRNNRPHAKPLQNRREALHKGQHIRGRHQNVFHFSSFRARSKTSATVKSSSSSISQASSAGISNISGRSPKRLRLWTSVSRVKR